MKISGIISEIILFMVGAAIWQYGVKEEDPTQVNVGLGKIKRHQIIKRSETEK